MNAVLRPLEPGAQDEIIEALGSFVRAGQKLNQAKREYRQAGEQIATVSRRYNLAIAPAAARGPYR